MLRERLRGLADHGLLLQRVCRRPGPAINYSNPWCLVRRGDESSNVQIECAAHNRLGLDATGSSQQQKRDNIGVGTLMAPPVVDSSIGNGNQAAIFVRAMPQIERS